MTAMKIALGLVTGIVLLAGQNTGTPSSHGEDILSWVQWPAPMACPPQQQHAGASRWFAPTIMRHCGAGGHRLTGRPDRGSRSQRGKSSPPALALTITGRISSLSTRLFTSARIAPAAAANFSSTPERVFFHGANRSEATAVLSLRCRYRWSGQFWARGTR
jgi:hypothetical protein